MSATLPLRAIGVVRCAVAEGRDEDWGDVVSELHLDAALAPGLDGIEDFSHLIVVYWMHESSRVGRAAGARLLLARG